MDRRYINNVKDLYRDTLASIGEPDRAFEIVSTAEFAPILKVRPVHPEQEPEPKDTNDMISDITFDIMALDGQIIETAQDFKALMEDTKTRLKSVKTQLEIEKERQQDINILCNNYTDFMAVVNLSDSDFEGNFVFNNGAFSAEVKQQVDVPFEIVNIQGNGYEGNQYVLKDGEFLSDAIDTSNRDFITDGSNITVYEYSRITASSSEKEIFPLVNFDSIEARCTVTIRADKAFNTLNLVSESSDIIVSSIYISDDGVQFKQVSNKEIAINNKENKYQMQDYVHGTGIICFPTTKYLKLNLQSNGFTGDTIAFEKSEIIIIPPRQN